MSTTSSRAVSSISALLGAFLAGYKRFVAELRWPDYGMVRDHSTALSAGRPSLRKRRDGYGVVVDRAVDACCEFDRTSAQDERPRGSECAVLHCFDGLPVAAASKRVSAVLDRAGVFLPVVA